MHIFSYCSYIYIRYEKSLVVKKIVLGEHHFSVGHTLYNMSCLLIDNKQYNDALVMLQSTLDVYTVQYSYNFNFKIYIEYILYSCDVLCESFYNKQKSCHLFPLSEPPLYLSFYLYIFISFFL